MYVLRADEAVGLRYVFPDSMLIPVDVLEVFVVVVLLTACAPGPVEVLASLDFCLVKDPGPAEVLDDVLDCSNALMVCATGPVEVVNTLGSSNVLLVGELGAVKDLYVFVDPGPVDVLELLVCT